MVVRIKHFLHLLYLYVITRIIYLFKRPPKVLNSYDSLKVINEKKLSVSRYGDGEFNIINGKSIKFQDYDKKLAERLEEVLYSDREGVAICIPAIYKFNITRQLKYNEEIFWLEELVRYSNIYLSSKYKDRIYYDACLSRPYIRYKNRDIGKTLFKEISNLWDKQDILIVEGKYSRLGVGNDLFNNAKSIKRVLCPNKNAFSKYNKILNFVKKNCADRLVFIALGPTATVMAYDLANSGIRAIDLGHLDLEYEWFLSGAKEKEVVKNKIVNEVDENTELTEIKEKKYLESIMTEIK